MYVEADFDIYFFTNSKVAKPGEPSFLEGSHHGVLMLDKNSAL